MVDALGCARLKLVRASEHIQAVRKAIWNYTAEEPSRVVRHPDGTHELNFAIAPPDAISILSGEVVYQIRSALDYMAFELVKLNPSGSVLPDGWEERCLFPLWLKAPKKRPVFNCFEHLLPGITKATFAFIEAAQPYNGGSPGNVLRLLATLSNIDKHRHLNITKPQALRRDEAVVLYKGRIYQNDSVVRVESGTKSESPFVGMDVKEVKVEGAFQPFVSFHESALGAGAATLPVEFVLQTCLDTVNDLVVPEFEKLI
jgi:hypothetical protein